MAELTQKYDKAFTTSHAGWCRNKLGHGGPQERTAACADDVKALQLRKGPVFEISALTRGAVSRWSRVYQVRTQQPAEALGQRSRWIPVCR